MPDPETIPVPNVIGSTQAAAEETLKSAGLVVGTVTTASSATTPVGNVSNANPAVGTLVSSGSPVNLEVSSGPASTPAQVLVPDVVGLTRPAAEAKLKSIGLLVGAVKTQHSDSVPDGGISSTNPEAGAPVSPASPVELDISIGPKPNFTQYLPTLSTGLFVILGFVVLLIIVYIVTPWGQTFLIKLADKEVARGLITFLITITTVGIAIILAISTIVLTAGDEGDKRFDRGKQVLSVLIGVLGTIVGFYFGSAIERERPSPLAITPITLPTGAVNTPYQSTTLQATGGTPPLKWSVEPTLSPLGLAWDAATGTISGTPNLPTKASKFKFTVTDSAKPAASSTADLTLEIKPPVSSASPSPTPSATP